MGAVTIAGVPAHVSPLVPPGKVFVANDVAVTGHVSFFVAPTTYLRLRYPQSPVFATRTRDVQAYERALARSRRGALPVRYRSAPVPQERER